MSAAITMPRNVVLRCLRCRWTWEYIQVHGERDDEPCPECDSDDVTVDRVQQGGAA